jgi:hypothetical protein
MTATTIPQQQGLGAHTWNNLLKALAIVALIVVLAVGAFAFGRSSADESNGVPASSGGGSEAPTCVHANGMTVC